MTETQTKTTTTTRTRLEEKCECSTTTGELLTLPEPTEEDALARDGVLFSAGVVDEAPGGALSEAVLRGWVHPRDYSLTRAGGRVLAEMRRTGECPE